ncbi:MAG TPA: zinc-binding dehydrogenase, partial [Solirubrobacteraceae bacterium]|nr:zinc-binding dehydrogenase [Solirubrobacteraceae bacterium]
DLLLWDMRAAVLHELRTVPVFGDFREPQPDEKHQVAEVLLGALNPVDLFVVAGAYGGAEVPCVVGREGVARLSGGAAVYFSGPAAPFGSLAQYAPVDPSTVFPIPDGLDPGLAVSMGIAGLAAWLPLTWRADLQPGETVLVLAASGVVGQIAVQAAKLLGAGRVVAAARDRKTLERLREQGADAIVVLEGDDRQALKDAAGDGYDVVVDPLYGPPLEAALSATAQGARVVTVGASAAESAAIPVSDIFGRTLTGHSNAHASLEVRRGAYGRLAGHAAAGEIRVEVERLPLSRIADAWDMQARGPHRKIALVP